MRKMWVIAVREYNAAVRTKAFVLSLVIMPLMMGGSIVVQWLLRDFRDVEEKTFAVIDRSSDRLYQGAVQQAVADHNNKARGVKPTFKIEEVELPPNVDRTKLEEKRAELAERVRKGELSGFLEIGPRIAEAAKDDKDEERIVRYQSNRLVQMEFPQLAVQAIGQRVRELRSKKEKLDLAKVSAVMRPVPLVSEGVSKSSGGQDRIAQLLVPAGLMMMMFMMVLLGATPLMQGVVEEKMQRIAEVLLGSVQPFPLMLGKIVGMTGVSLTIAAVYLGGAYWSAQRFGFAEHLPASLLLWFVLFQALSSLMYGSLFIAVGAACTDMKETQNLLWPIMLLATMPMFVLGNVIQEPNSKVATALSFFPFATPMLMIARQAVPPGVPWWQPTLGAAGVLATTLFCVWAAGRVFRVGLLMQGKGAKVSEMVRWVFRG